MDKRYYRYLERFKDPIITAYENNMTMQEIADQYKSSPATVYRLLKKYRVKTRRRGQRNANVKVGEPNTVQS